MPQPRLHDVEIRTFPATMAESGTPDVATAGWLRAESLGFLIPRRSPAEEAHLASLYVEDNRLLTGAYIHDDAGPGWSADHPVATYATMAKGMNVGGVDDLPLRLIADVTVRSTHRGRGLLSAIMRRDLGSARDHGVGAAALYAAKADIYGRYGFGPATRTCQVEVSPRHFRVRSSVDERIDVAEPARLVDVVCELHRAHRDRTFGSIEMVADYPRQVCGIGPDHDGGIDPAVRAFTHSDPAGAVDGVMTYRFRGWTPPRSGIEIIEILAEDPLVEIALWSAVCKETAADVVVNRHCPLDSPLPWALEDRRAYRQVSVDDGLWLRILDVPLALSARGFQCPDQAVTIALTDPLELSTGTYRVDVSDGRANVSQSKDEPDVSLGISTLSSLYLGGYSARELVDAGLVGGQSARSIRLLDDLFHVPRAPYCNTHF